MKFEIQPRELEVIVSVFALLTIFSLAFAGVWRWLELGRHAT